MSKVLFVCLGNICRSPAAEGVFTKMVADAGLNSQIQIDSCGTSGHHSGENADPRMIEHAEKRGYQLSSIARGLTPQDLDTFDWVITMDRSNYNNVLKVATPENRHKVKTMLSFAQEYHKEEVPDPYYGGPEGFEHVLDLLEDSCKGLLSEVRKTL